MSRQPNTPRPPANTFSLFDEDDESDSSPVWSQRSTTQVSTPAPNFVPPLPNPLLPLGDPLLSDDPLLNPLNDSTSEFALSSLTFPETSVDMEFSLFSCSPILPPYDPENNAAEYNDLSMLFLNELELSPAPTFDLEEYNNQTNEEPNCNAFSTTYSSGLTTNDISTPSYSNAYSSTSAMDTNDDNNAEALSSSVDDNQYDHRSDPLPTNPLPPVTGRSRGRKVPMSEGGTPPDPTRTIQCSMCGRWFHRGEHVKRHMATLHSNAKPYACLFPACNKVFSRRDNCKYHYNAHFKSAKGKKKADQEPKKRE